MDSCQFAGATQLLPHGPCSQQAALALSSLRQFLNGKVPVKPAKQLGAAANAFKWKEYRTSTKQLLVALANGLSNSMPDKFNFLAFRPETVLKPCPIHASRVALTDLEKVAQGFDPDVAKDLDLYYIHDHKTFERYPDYIKHDDSYHRLTMAADEGTEASPEISFKCFMLLEKFH